MRLTLVGYMVLKWISPDLFPYPQARFRGPEGGGLRVNFPNPLGGNSNTGPTSRRFFKNPETTAAIIGCSKEGVNFHTFFNLLLLLKRRVKK